MTEWDADALYRALVARDARFDGHFFVGVSSTGIYCRPVCRARTPRRPNCTFYRTAAQAEAAGFRPCLLCRPERAPGTSTLEARSDLARQAAQILQDTCGDGLSLEDLARRLGCSSRHLRRVFVDAYGVSPAAHLRTCRLLMAKQLLTDTALSVADVAMASGFGSVRRFNDVFRERYRLSPTALRAQRRRLPGTDEGGPARRAAPDGVTLGLGYRPPYRWDDVLRFLEARAIPGVEAVRRAPAADGDAGEAGGEYARTVRVVAGDGTPRAGWVRVGNDPRSHVLTVTLAPSLLPVLPQVLARVSHLFDLSCDPRIVADALDPALNHVRPGAFRAGTRVPGCFDAFEMAARAILGQQVNVQAARTLAGRVAANDALGTAIDTGITGLTRLFPTPETIAALSAPGEVEDRLGPLGITRTRARSLLAIAQGIADGPLALDPRADPARAVAALQAIPGVGPWTANYLAMRALGWPDVFLETDIGIRRALAPPAEAAPPSSRATRRPAPTELRAMAEAWRPWRSYATVSLWNSL